MEATSARRQSARGPVSRYWHTDAEQMQFFASGESWISDAWLMRIHALQKQKLPIACHQAPGLHRGFAAFAAIAEAPADPLYQVIDILLRPEVLIAIAEQRGVPTALDPKKHSMPATIAAMPGYDPSGELADARIMDPAYWVTSADAWRAAYRRLKVRG